MERMRKNVRASLRRPEVLSTAREIIAAARLAPRDELGQARAVRKWVDAHFHFVKDPLGIELLETPSYLLAKIQKDGRVQGDCDDAATLSAALCASIGIPPTFYALAFGKQGTTAPYQHVITVAHPLDSVTRTRVAVDFDVTKPKDMSTPRVARKLAVKI
jgi:transglutaminase-like putative cysteine protease